MIEERIKSVIRDIPDFPKPGIIFKDITPVFKDYRLCDDIVSAFVERLEGVAVDAVVGVESRGFLLGPMIASRLAVPFIPVRKKGKLPAKTICRDYGLEYGSGTLEIHEDALSKGMKVLVHDDLLATGGTAQATRHLVNDLGAEVVSYAFIVGLDFLKGSQYIQSDGHKLIVLVRYDD